MVNSSCVRSHIVTYYPSWCLSTNVQSIFSFAKTKRPFSRIALDQVHEQNNKMIKRLGGAAGLLNTHESALIRWKTCNAEVARNVSVFEDSL